MSGSTFGGPTGAQAGSHNTQHNTFILAPAPPESTGRRWRTTVGIAAALVLIGTTVVVAVELSGNGRTRDTGQVTGTSAAGAPAADTSAPAASPTPARSPSRPAVPAPVASLSPDSDTIQFQGQVRIAESGPRLDLVPPGRDNSYLRDLTLSFADPPRITGDDYTGYNPTPLAMWTDTTRMPTRQECADLIATKGIGTIAVKKGTVFCDHTHEGRIAVLTITDTSNDYNTGEMAEAVVWAKVSG
ncbi:hypothetical protein [Kitasatospora mediocidica]|uniref:hypothetical protein n=1 Tax=Kitasatospora mediocidica TaxID=58352 RepID=UPI0005613FDF|nr:hypothetical protein [Kitasatospora mediocidica]